MCMDIKELCNQVLIILILKRCIFSTAGLSHWVSGLLILNILKEGTTFIYKGRVLDSSKTPQPLKVKTVCSFKMSAINNRAVQCHKPEVLKPHHQHDGNANLTPVKCIHKMLLVVSIGICGTWRPPHTIRKMCDLVRLQQSKWDIHSSGMLHSADWKLVFEVSGQPIRPVVEGQIIQVWPLKMGLKGCPETSITINHLNHLCIKFQKSEDLSFKNIP